MSLTGGKWVWNGHTTWATETDVQGSSARMESSPVSQSRLISFSQTLVSSPEGTAYEQGRSQRVSRHDTQVLPPSSFSCPPHRQFLGSCPKMLSRRTCREPGTPSIVPKPGSCLTNLPRFAVQSAVLWLLPSASQMRSGRTFKMMDCICRTCGNPISFTELLVGGCG